MADEDGVSPHDEAPASRKSQDQRRAERARASVEPGLDLTPHELDEVRRALKGHRRRAPKSAEWLWIAIRGWRHFVEDVEQGYDDIGDEYEFDLSGRDALEDALDRMSPALRTKLSGLVAPLDERFRRATRPIEEPIHKSRAVQGHWWWWRVPLILVGDLQDLDEYFPPVH